MDEDKVDSLNDSRDNNDDEYRDDNLEGFREDNIDNYGDVEEDKEPGKDIKPEPPPQPPLYRPSRPPIRLSFIGTTSFRLRTGKPGMLGSWEDRSVFRNRDLKKITELKSHLYYLNSVKEEEEE